MRSLRFVSFTSLLFGIGAAVCADIAKAHDFWIQPSRYRAKVGEIIRVALRVGDAFPGEPVKRDPDRIERFVALDADGEQAVTGKASEDPAGTVRVRGAGAMTIGYHSQFKRIELDAAKFEEYLRSAGLERIIETRAQRNQTQATGRESYCRCAIALVGTPETRPSNAVQSPGFPLVLLPLQFPDTADQAPRKFRLLFEGKPVSGALVVARHITSGEMPAQTARTDHNGVVQFALTQPGPWLLTNVHMTEAPSGGDVDWRSYWASLTFELADAASATSQSSVPAEPSGASKSARVTTTQLAR